MTKEEANKKLEEIIENYRKEFIILDKIRKDEQEKFDNSWIGKIVNRLEF